MEYKKYGVYLTYLTFLRTCKFILCLFPTYTIVIIGNRGMVV